MNLFTKFLADRRGNFAIMTGLSIIPLLLAVGLFVDYNRGSSARSRLQDIADATSLALATTRDTDVPAMRARAQEMVNANLGQYDSTMDSIQVANLTVDDTNVDLTLTSNVPTTFARLGGLNDMAIQAHSLAERAAKGTVELALILDNTWSMSAPDASGGTKLSTLQQASKDLASLILKSSTTRVAVVPYAESVNVGLDQRGKNWLQVGADVPQPDYCSTPKTYTCTQMEVEPCTSTADGITTPRECLCLASTNVPTGPETCQPISAWTWYGCVGTRTSGDDRLAETNATTRPYIGLIDSEQTCPTPIVPLTNSKSAVLNAIDGLQIENPHTGYRPETYIPSGLIWGLNVLSPDQPFTEGQAFDPENLTPRKVAVLMTDGTNTMYYLPGETEVDHISYDAASERDNDRARTDADSLAICSNLKAQKIEVFTVAFMVDDPKSNALLQGCATNPAHYFNAADGAALLDAFKSIGDSLTTVRLAR